MTAPVPQQPAAVDHRPGNKPLAKRVGHSMLLVRLIAMDKFIKGLCLLIIGGFVLHMIRGDHNLHDTLQGFINDLRIDPDNHHIHALLDKTLGITKHTMWGIYVGTLIYAGLYFIEGIGLYFDKAWAEWLTIICTAGFLPLEIKEIHDKFTWFRVTVFVLNILMVVYLGLRLHWRHEAKKAGIDVKHDPEAHGQIHAPIPAKAPPGDGNLSSDSHR